MTASLRPCFRIALLGLALAGCKVSDEVSDASVDMADTTMSQNIDAPDLTMTGCADNRGCGEGQACCAGQCIGVLGDASNCGRCGNACGGGGVCCAGSCSNPATDLSNCGGCGNACTFAHASASCAAGACTMGGCEFGWGDCDKNPQTGCESNVHTDPSNCGGCGTSCNIANGIPGCADGCYLKACQFGWDDCNNDLMDGCETSVLSDTSNCGACGNSCVGKPNAQVACVQTACQIEGCTMGWLDCDSNTDTGCEVNGATDAKNCGGCGVVCAQGLVCKGSQCTCPNCNYPNASSKCVNNQCVFDKCNPGYSDCDNNTNNGCEAFIAGDSNNCGGCGIVCPQNMLACVNSMCTMSPCIGNQQWQRVTCKTDSWVWSRDRAKAMTVQAAANAKVLATGCKHGQPQPDLGNGVCSLDGKGWVSTKTFVMQGCDASWWHLGGSFTGGCGGHDGDIWRHLVLTDNDCYAY